MTSYSITLQSENGNDEVQLTAKTDTGARRQCSAWLKNNPQPKGTKIHLSFYRRSDGCNGTIDR